MSTNEINKPDATFYNKLLNIKHQIQICHSYIPSTKSHTNYDNWEHINWSLIAVENESKHTNNLLHNLQQVIAFFAGFKTQAINTNIVLHIGMGT